MVYLVNKVIYLRLNIGYTSKDDIGARDTAFLPTTIPTYLLYIYFYIEYTFDFRNILLRNTLLINLLLKKS